MLVLSRRRDEQIVIGHNIVITIVDVRGDKVRLGIDAPQEVTVHRREVYEAIQREKGLRGNLGGRETGPTLEGALLQEVSRPFGELAMRICGQIGPSPERTVAHAGKRIENMRHDASYREVIVEASPADPPLDPS